MKKSNEKHDIQESINEKCFYANKAAFTELLAACNYDLRNAKSVRLRTCYAKVYETENWYILQSYDTIVCVIWRQGYEIYDFLRTEYGYTATSAQHIAKFIHDYTPYPWNSPRFTAR